MTTLDPLIRREHARLLESVRRANVIREPFPHTIIDGALSSEFILQAYQCLPGKAQFSDAGHGLLAFQIWDKSEELAQWQSRRKVFWQHCNDARGSTGAIDKLLADVNLLALVAAIWISHWPVGSITG